MGMSDEDKLECPLSADGWEDRYKNDDTGWDLGGPPPALVKLLDDLGDVKLRVFIPGAGFGNDAIAWAAAQHRVTAVDYAPSAVAGAIEKAKAANVALEVLEHDLFDLPDTLAGSFDAVWEQTCFCAIHPDRRVAYAEAVAGVLEPGGAFYGLFWNHGVADGPPFDVTADQVRNVFGERFVIDSLDPAHESVESRNNEFVARMRLR